MLFTVLTGGGSKGAGNNPAVDMQTQRMHDDLLDITKLPDYPLVMALPPGPQKRLAMDALEAEAAFNEATVPQYWLNDNKPRRQVTLGSSWVPNIQYDPKTKVMTAFGKAYAGVEPETVAKILRGEIYVHKPGSIGSAMNKFWDERFGHDRLRGRALSK